MNGYIRFILSAVVAVLVAVVMLAIGNVIFGAAPPDEPADGMHLQEFGILPIVDRGRTKSLEAMARTDLTLIRGTQTFRDEKGNGHSAVEWVLDAMTSRRPFTNGAAYDHQVFRIDNDQIKLLLNLKNKPEFNRYSLAELEPKWNELVQAIVAAEEKKEADRDLTDTKLLELGEHLKTHMSLAELKTPLLLDPSAPGAPPKSVEDILEEYRARVQAAKGDENTVPAPSPFLVMLVAYDKHDAPAFNAALATYQKQIAKAYATETYKAGVEAAFNDFAPFFQCAILYLGVFILTCLSWVVLTKPLNLSAMMLAAVTLIVHTGALVVRMYLMNRWGVFVTNLYGTAIFIGWVAAILGFLVELRFRNGIGNFVLSVAGFTTMIIAQFLAVGEDTMEMMRAVLDTNFWLATHVTSINVGYAGTCVAGLLGALYIFRGVLTTSLDRPAVKTIGDALYGVVCFATLFSFTGTVLGGIWADQSWGRFWGWDPKENGALLIVIWNALILHARWGGLIKQRGMAVLALFGNIITIWSWWGVNMLGIGLHAYADASMAMLATVLTAVGIHLAIMVVGLLPQNLWGSFAAMNAAPPPPVPPAAPNGRQRGRGKTGTGIVPQPA